MYSFRRFAFLLMILSAAPLSVLAQSPTSSSDPAVVPPNQNPSQTQAPAPPSTDNRNGQVTVQSRIRARREQRRAQAIHDTYSHTYEAFVGGGYQRLTPGPNLQHLTMYSWDVALTRYWNDRLGVTIDGRGYYGTAFVGLNSTSVTRPAISHYDGLIGPTYRFYMRPRYSLAARVMGGVAHSNFSSDTNGFGTAVLGLYPDSTSYAISAGVLGEANVSANLSLRLAPEYFSTGFGSKMQNDYGFTYGFVYRLGK